MEVIGEVSPARNLAFHRPRRLPMVQVRQMLRGLSLRLLTRIAKRIATYSVEVIGVVSPARNLAFHRPRRLPMAQVRQFSLATATFFEKLATQMEELEGGLQLDRRRRKEARRTKCLK